MEGDKRKGGGVLEEQEREKAAAINEELKLLLLRHLEQPAVRPTAIAGLTLVRREAANSSERCFEKPLASILVQGSKHTVIGTRAFSIAAKQCLVAAVETCPAHHTWLIRRRKNLFFLFSFIWTGR